MGYTRALLSGWGAFILTVASASAAELPQDCRNALMAVPTLTRDAGASSAIAAAIETQLGTLAKTTWAPGYCKGLADNFASKAASFSEGVTFTTQKLLATGVAFEAFRVTAFRNSGVAPKRYFGFLDEQGTSAVYEKQLKVVATRIAPMLNAYAQKKGLGITVTPKEIIVTHIAEGAALLLTTKFSEIDNIHPVSGVGLDDYRHGFKQYADLVSELDATFKTKLGTIADNPERPLANQVFHEGTVRFLEQKLGIVSMTFEESILGTAVMYLWEKAITEQKRKNEGRPSLASLSLDEQYVQASLVYNSGILFADERAKQIMEFSTATYLVETSEKAVSKRPKLPVLSP